MPRYRLGFLLCDQPLEHLADEFGDYPSMFMRAFGAVSCAIDWQVYDVTAGALPAQPTDCDGWLISGSRHGAYDALPWITSFTACVRSIAASPQPLVGLCFGHQIIGHALGAAVRKAPQGWGLGIHAYDIVESAEFMQPPREEIVLPVCHQDQVLSLPPGARRLARSTHCENFIVQFAPKVLGIQGHPEFEPDFIAALVEWRRARLPPETYAAARASLTRAHDNLLVRRWIARFLDLPMVHH